ncbi:hypothetical protein ACF3NG_00785 [Aerococcaceae bacterium WGS1372]
MNNLKWKFSRFMIGRYGADSLYQATVILVVILQLIHFFTKNPSLNFISLVLIVRMLFRVFSKNIVARRQENTLYVSLANKVKKRWKIEVRRVREYRTHRYRQCEQCKTVMRLPRKRGTHTAKCPKCGHSNKVRILM